MNSQQLIAYPQGTTEPLIYPTGEIILDMYKDAPIPLVLVADDFTNTSDRAGGYSKSFDIPGTKKNNIFFNHIYTINSDSTFNIHIKTAIILKDGFINVFAGYLQLNTINDNIDGISYNITIYDNTVNLKSALSERVFRDLDMSELTHNYDAANIEDSWTTGLPLITPLAANSFAGNTGATTTTVVKYPMVQWNNNASYTSSTITSNNLEDFFKPFVNLKYVLQNILRDVGYTVDFNFTTPAQFDNLFLDFNKGWGVGVFIVQNTGDVNYPSSLTTYDGNIIENEIGIDGSLYYDLTTDTYTSLGTSSVTFTGRFVVKSSSGGGTIVANVRSVATGGSVYTQSYFNVAAGSTLNFNVQINYMTVGLGFYVTFQAINAFVMDKSSLLRISVSPSIHYIQDTLIGYKGDTNQWEFVKDIINMFNLVIVPIENRINHVSILPYNDWVDTGNQLDYTNKIDLNDLEYKPLDGLAKTTFFKFTEDDGDYITEAHNHPNDWRYSQTVIQDIELFDNPENTVELSHIAATYYGAAYNGNVFIPKIMNSEFNNDWENKFRVLYDNGVTTLGSGTIEVNNLFGGGYVFNSYLRFSTKQDGVSGISYNYGIVSYDYSYPWINSLYNTFWFKYMDELYNPETRIITVKAYLTAKDIYEIKFNDIIMIKNRNFRVIKITYNNSGLSELELITIKYL
tara:strand:- start:604 stop:2655 length:2052 start_codon:yes stop_codon:yes gene_type:complete